MKPVFYLPVAADPGRQGGGIGAIFAAVDGFAADAEQQFGDRGTVRSRRGAGHVEQERQAGRRARIHVALVVGRAVEVAERLLPGRGVG